MGFKFRKRIKVMPGLTINLSKSGISTTVGTKGLSVNLGKKGAYLNTGIPGTGIYNREKLAPNKSDDDIKYKNNTKENRMSNRSVALEIQRLASLRDNGVITEDEFQREKNKVLNYEQEKTINEEQILSSYIKMSKKRTKASFIAFFFGFLGLHKFYLGRTWQGIIYLILFFTGLSFFLWLIDIFILGFMSDERFLLKYNRNLLLNLGVDIDYIDRNSSFYDLLVRNGSKYRYNGGFISTILKIVLLVLLFVIAFVSVQSNSEHNKSYLRQMFGDNKVEKVK
ncbi:DUF4236 domain-containing protein [Gallibacterium salpingitidis]|uniref:DUF4236 domain-containing protein n=1 Tax=Gallibacterium salpingitidis TaxID=505341 RepID=UPI00266EEF4B|nr:DUF4236 domain-containing protein [Gallibacterium salpingitidis]WKT00537.1 DUF4236 domain-containing protein [Gallibacterium salpingitidis]